MRQIGWVVLLGALFSSLYVIARSLPAVRCGVLHYAEVERPDGTTEFCATGHSAFLDLSRIRFPASIELDVTGPVVPGEVQEVEFGLYAPDGSPMRPDALAVTHTEKLHLMLVDPSMEDYAHVHPQPLGDSGRYRFSFVPERAGTYRVFAEFVPLRTLRQMVVEASIEVDGPEDSVRFDGRNVRHNADLKVQLEQGPQRLRVGRQAELRLRVTDPEGNPAQLDDLMGAKAHLVAFDHGQRGIAHMHPDEDGGEALAFVFNPPFKGQFRVWAQFKVAGRERFVPFDLDVR